MTPPAERRPLALSQRVYGALLRAYPRGFRQSYGPVMAQLFRDCCRDAYERRQHTLGDLLSSAGKERIAAIADSLPRWSTFRRREATTPPPFPTLRELAQVIQAG